MIFSIFFVLNLVLWANGSSAAIPFTTFIALLALWFCVSTPLVFFGAYLGFRRPVRSNWTSCTFVAENGICLGNRKSRSNESDPAANSWADFIHETLARHSHGRCSSIWLHIHSVVLHLEQYLVGSLFIVIIPRRFSSRAHQYYYFFGFLLVVFIILLITCSETTILLCYFHLCAEVFVDELLERCERRSRLFRTIIGGGDRS